MPYDGPIGFARITSLIMNVFVGVVLGLVFMVLTYDPSSASAGSLARGFLQSLVMSVPVGYAISDFVPSMRIANSVADALRLKRGLLRHCVTCCIFGTANVTLIFSSCMTIMLLKDAGVMGVANAIAAMWAPAVASGVVAIILLLPVAQGVASRVSGFSPEP